MSITTKSRVSISINKKTLDRLDAYSETKFASRSEAIEHILSEYVNSRKKCVILAGGKPQNLKVNGTYAPLTKIGGKPLILDSIAKANKAGYHDIIIIGHKDILAEIYKITGENNITFIEEKEAKNTANTLALAKPYIKSTFLFIPCDHYFKIDLADMEQYHYTHNAECTLAIYSGVDYAWNKSSLVKMSGNKITSYVESPKKESSHLTSLFIGFAEPSIFDKIPESNITFSLQKDVFPQLVKIQSLYGYLYDGEWKNYS